MRPRFIKEFTSTYSEDFSHLSEVLDLKWYHYVLIESLMVSPCLFIIFINWRGVNILLTMLIYFLVTLLLTPIAFMYTMNCPLVKFLYNEFEHITKQISNGFIFFLTIFFSVIISYLFITHNNTQILLIPNQSSELFVISATMFFSLANPIFEEWFWRVFIRKVINPQEKELLCLFISLHFAAQYGLIIYGLSHSLIKTGCFTLFFFLAHRLFQFIGDKSGVISSLLAQMGLNIAISIIVIDIINKKQ